MKLSTQKTQDFKQTIWSFYEQYGRDFAWRHVTDPYKVVISEVMLQQTQTQRVIEKYEQWMEVFPTFQSLAEASLRDVLSVWQGLGYNRRGMYLHKLAQHVVFEWGCILPNDPEKLVALPGIGPATAASICAFAFNNPTIFIETNIRAVFIHFFFKDKNDVHDKDILELIKKTVDRANARAWYYALMDYGVMLKKTMPNPSRKSAHYTKQSKFEGSDRQIRGKIIALLTDHAYIMIHTLPVLLKTHEDRIEIIIAKMKHDGLIMLNSNKTISIFQSD